MPPQPGIAARAMDTAADVSQTIGEVAGGLKVAIDRLSDADPHRTATRPFAVDHQRRHPRSAARQPVRGVSVRNRGRAAALGLVVARQNRGHLGRRANILQEVGEITLQRRCLLLQCGGLGAAVGFPGHRTHIDDRPADGGGPAGGLFDVTGDLAGGSAVLLDRGSDGVGDLGDLASAPTTHVSSRN